MGSKHLAASSLTDSLKAKTEHLLISIAQDKALNWVTASSWLESRWDWK